MSTGPTAPVPSHILRVHGHLINTVSFSSDNERLYSGDASGLVVITSTRTLRSLASWKAHKDGLLGVEELDEVLITHGRDNKLHVWDKLLVSEVADAAVLPDLPIPTLRYSMDVNALNFCRFSLMRLPGSHTSENMNALMAVPNLVESSFADIWALPSRQRLHAAIGKKGPFVSSSELDGRGTNNTGILMSIHLYSVPHPSTSDRVELRLLAAYEDGSVTLWNNTSADRESSIEGVGWESIWSIKKHVESVMAMAVSFNNAFALSVSADNLLVRYDLNKVDENNEEIAHILRMKQPGHGAVTFRDDGRVCAVGGWDGKIRLFSTKSLKSLGTLFYHLKNCQTVAFAHNLSSEIQEDEDPDDDMTEEEKESRSRWLAAGSHDCRLTIWELMSFQKS